MTVEISDDVFQSYTYFSAILVVKMLLMAFLTARHRFSKKIFANPEDVVRSKKAKISFDDPDVERVRRAHLNDLENILPFFFIGFLYCCTLPDPWTANLLFKLYTGARIVHTIVYAVVPFPQPTRAIVYEFANLIAVYLAVRVIIYFA